MTKDVTEAPLEAVVRPVAWMREWESDLGHMIFEIDEAELDDSPNWVALYTEEAIAHMRSRMLRAIYQRRVTPTNDRDHVFNAGVDAAWAAAHSA